MPSRYVTVTSQHPKFDAASVLCVYCNGSLTAL
jgi:hypothetical protein